MEAQESTIETGEHPEGSLGQIKVNHTVVSTIVKMATINVSGVLAVGGSFVENFIAQISSKESDKGVRVSEEEEDRGLDIAEHGQEAYALEVHIHCREHTRKKIASSDPGGRRRLEAKIHLWPCSQAQSLNGNRK